MKFELSGSATKTKRGPKTDQPASVFAMGFERAAQTIPESNIKAGPQYVLLWRQTKTGCVIPIQSLEVDPSAPLPPQAEEWAAENGWDVVRHMEFLDSPWPAVTTLRKKTAIIQMTIHD